jgi:hypothetical protein
MINVGTRFVMRCYCHTQTAFTFRFTIVNDIKPQQITVLILTPQDELVFYVVSLIYVD